MVVPAAVRLEVRWMGRVGYDDAWALQRELAAGRRAEQIPDTVLLLEHSPTITLGRGAHPENVLLEESELTRLGIAVREVDRGGDVTFHGPGQLVGYPIIDLDRRGRDVHRYLRDLEEVLIRTLFTLGIDAGRSPGATGVWVKDRKIAAIGVKVSRWVTSHGFALNVGPDISGFQTIIPCGIRDRGVTSVSIELARTLTVDDAAVLVEARLRDQFEVQ